MKEYNVFYKDGTFMTIELSKEDFDAIARSLTAKESHVAVSKCILALEDIRMIVERKEVKQEKERPILPVLDIDSEEFLRERLASIWGEGEGAN